MKLNKDKFYKINYDNDGFTILELIMVLTIIIMIGFIITPRFLNLLHSKNINYEARKLTAKIREVQQLAISEQITYRITFDINNELYEISYSPSFLPIETIKLQNKIDLNVITFTDITNSVQFDAFGAPNEPGDIILQDTTGNYLTISITENTGRVTFQ